MTDNVLDNLENTPKPEDILSTLVGPDKKYKSIEDLAKSRLDAESFIEQLKSENSEMRKELTDLSKKVSEADTIASLFEEIKGLKNSQQNSGEPTATISEEELSSKVKGIVDNISKESTLSANYAKANSLLLEHVGNDTDKAAEFVRKRATELGLTIDTVKDLGKASPAAFAEMLGLKTKQTPQGSVSSLPGRQGDPFKDEVRDLAYYTKLRLELGAKYWDTEIQNQKMKDAMALGDRFFKKE